VLPNLIRVDYSKNKCLGRAWKGRLRPRTSVDEMNHIYYISLLMAYLSELTKATTSDVIDWIRKWIGNGCDNNRIGEVTWSYVNRLQRKYRALNTMAYTGSVRRKPIR